jgi:carboxymethylenebutenolidase
LGGFVAADAAARDERIAALAVLYGGMPDAMVPEVKHLPPLIELHGEADRNVPFAMGELVKLGKAVGAEAELVAYPGKPHGFDFFGHRSNDNGCRRSRCQVLRIPTQARLNLVPPTA